SRTIFFECFKEGSIFFTLYYLHTKSPFYFILHRKFKKVNNAETRIGNFPKNGAGHVKKHGKM
ncbi:hypothetical protein, partial [uncultured Dubosiella sp.]|uniref:hypothetical protein n=1 Tax=uncultured Dubosiella sp. TaxID=1937011 RepID=UPI00272BDFDC